MPEPESTQAHARKPSVVGTAAKVADTAVSRIASSAELAKLLALSNQALTSYLPVCDAHAKMLSGAYDAKGEETRLEVETFAAVEAARRTLLTKVLEAEGSEELELLAAKLEAVHRMARLPVRRVEVPVGSRRFVFEEKSDDD